MLFRSGEGNAGATGVLEQDIATVPGGLYEFSFDFSAGGLDGLNGGPGGVGLQIDVLDSFGNVIETLTVTEDIVDNTFSTTTLRFTASDVSTTLRFSDISTTTVNIDPHLDNVSLRKVGLTPVDTDSDGINDYRDLDSYNDGISDLIESGQDASVVYTNNDGRNDGAVDANGVPIAAAGGVTPVDTDGDLIADYRDLDSDGDSIADAVEARPTAGYVSSTRVNNATNNGINDDGLYVPVDTDGDSTADYLDTDSDNDGLLDSAESGLTPGADLDGDGIGDGVGASYADPDGNVNNPSADLANQFGDTSEIAFRESDEPPLIDLNDDNTTADLDFAATFTEGDVPLSVANVAADVIDGGDNITSIQIVVGGNVDGASEIATIAGQAFDLSVDSTVTGLAIGGSSVDIAFMAGTGTFTITNNTGAANPVPQADFDTLIRAITYENISENPTAGDRTLSFTATDANAQVTASAAVATITVVAVNDAPVGVDDGPVAVDEDTPVSGNVIANDTDADGDVLTVTTFVIAGDATVYNPVIQQPLPGLVH